MKRERHLTPSCVRFHSGSGPRSTPKRRVAAKRGLSDPGGRNAWWARARTRMNNATEPVVWQFPARMSYDASRRPLEMEQLLGRRVAISDDALSQVSKVVRKSAAGLRAPERPFATFVFLGPNRDKKIALARALAGHLYGDESMLAHFDLARFQSADAVERLLGGPLIAEGELSAVIRRSPCSVILFDELRIAHRDVWDLFTRICGDGIINDACGRPLDFKPRIVIATTDVGAQYLPVTLKPDDQEGCRQARAAIREEIERTFPSKIFLGNVPIWIGAD